MHALLSSLPPEGEVMSWDSSPNHAKPAHPLRHGRPSGATLSILYFPLFSVVLRRPNYAGFIRWRKGSKSGRQTSVPQAGSFSKIESIAHRSHSSFPRGRPGAGCSPRGPELGQLVAGVMEHTVKWLFWPVSVRLFLALYIHGYCNFLHGFYNSHKDILVPVFF